jgi:uncharacterized protein YdaU (DUF1376 family)
MHYFQFNWKDYIADTAYLNLCHHGAYLKLIGEYYKSEKPLPLNIDELSEILILRSQEEVDAVKNILERFFTETENGYIHKRCDVEIEAYHDKSNKASKSAKARWHKAKKKDANAMQTQCEGNANHKPLNIKHKQDIQASNKFDLFWLAYPSNQRKVNKEGCRRHWISNNLDTVVDKIVSHVNRMKESKDWIAGFVPMPMTYLNQRRWEAEDRVGLSQSPVINRKTI